jgi:small conductance mechanosensitive channel
MSAVPVAGQDAACFDDASSICGFVYDLTGREGLARTLDFLLARPLTIALIVVLALILRRIVNRSLTRVVESAADTSMMSERRRQRADTMCSILRSITSFAIFSIALVMILGELGLELAPIIASAGIVGVALGFGAQNLVKDFLAGVFMILEDQYGVGDEIDTGVATGAVEAVGLRTTRLRDTEGVVWHVRNGEILRVGNRSQRVGGPGDVAEPRDDAPGVAETTRAAVPDAAAAAADRSAEGPAP